MNFVIRFARRDTQGLERYRDVGIAYKDKIGSRAWALVQEDAIVEHMRKGERIVQISEAGYHS